MVTVGEFDLDRNEEHNVEGDDENSENYNDFDVENESECEDEFENFIDIEWLSDDDDEELAHARELLK